MEKYDKDVVESRFKRRRWARKSTSSGNYDRTLSLILAVFAFAALLLFLMMVIGFWGG